MRTSAIALALAGGAQLVAAHTTVRFTTQNTARAFANASTSKVWNVLVNKVDQGVGNKQGGYIDSPPNNNPVLEVTSKDIECNVAGVKASKSINAAGGDEITFQWFHDTNSASDDIIASVRLHSCFVRYMVCD